MSPPSPQVKPTWPYKVKLLPMILSSLAQAIDPVANSINPGDKALINFLLIAAILGIGLLVVLGLLIAWRNLIQRQREMEAEHEMREEGLAHPDAWSTAGQRIEPQDAGPNEAHVSQEPGLGPEEDRDPFEDDDDDDDDEDDFPFDRDDEDDDDDDQGPFDRA